MKNIILVVFLFVSCLSFGLNRNLKVVKAPVENPTSERRKAAVIGMSDYGAGRSLDKTEDFYYKPRMDDEQGRIVISDKPVEPVTPAVHPSEPIKTVTAAKRNGEVWNPDGFEMVFVEGGTFTMGCTLEQEDDCNRNEKPSHQVTVSDFYIGKYEVTQAQWKEVMGTTVREQRDKENTELPIRGEGDNYPMYYVSWDEAQEFIRRLNVETGKQYRLPTEAEWEFAARGGSSSRGYKYSGGNTAGAVAWFSENSNESSHPVGTKSSNELGIYDMSGNVWEWCSDWYGNYSSNAQTDPRGPSSGTERVVRGGSYVNFERIVLASSRRRITPDVRGDALGFRLACSSK